MRIALVLGLLLGTGLLGACGERDAEGRGRGFYTGGGAGLNVRP